jgi:hypothetical protein
MNDDLHNSLRYFDCVLCEEENNSDNAKRYTRNELPAHIQAAHPQWRLCKGCNELVTKSELEREKGWCGLCVYLCYDCMDTDKYPEEI